MKRKIKNTIKIKKSSGIWVFIIAIILIAMYITNYYTLENSASIIASRSSAHVDTSSLDENLQIHFIDVGQADSILIKQGSKAMLIDSGEYETNDIVNNYLKKQQVSKLDYLVSSHPHSDHIGAMYTIIDNFEVDRLLVSNATHTTGVYRKFLESVNKKNLTKEIPKVGDTFKFGEASFEIVGPINTINYGENKNNYSLVIKLTFYNNTFLFTGDAEKESEDDMIKKKANLNCDLLKVGHHGSDSSTSEVFLKAVSPKYAVISDGKNNKYGFPDKKVLNLLKENDIEVYRTDESGTIVAISDGNNITFNKEPSSYE